jgi:hypothetical protein
VQFRQSHPPKVGLEHVRLEVLACLLGERRNQSQSNAISRNQSQSVAISRSQSQSVAIRGTRLLGELRLRPHERRLERSFRFELRREQ